MKIKIRGSSSLLVEASCFFFLLGLHLVFLKHFHQFHFYDMQGFRWFALIISPVPVLFLYFLSRVFLGPFAASVGVASLEFILSVAHANKVAVMYEALYSGDLVEVTHLPIVLQYLKMGHIVLLAAILGIWLVALLIDRKIGNTPRQIRKLYFVLGLMLIPMVFYLPLIKSNSTNIQFLNQFLDQRSLVTVLNNWVESVRKRGLPYHLIYTSFIKIPAHPDQTQQAKFNDLIDNKNSNFSRPKKIIYVLCESCWHDGKNFFDSFEPLKKRGFTELRAISPVYGGATANAAFEMLTGLPSRTESLDGVIYQEYAASMGKKAQAFPRFLLNLGYSTIAIHNYDKHFWHRHIVNPKFGFQKFIGLQDMKYTKKGWPEDSILYEAAIKVLEEKKNDPLFLYLTTVYSHGPYQDNNDLGASDYKAKLDRTISDLTKFIDFVSKKYPDSFFLIYGDHKPSLTKFFVQNGVVSQKTLDEGYPWDSIGDVPVYVRGSKQTISHQDLEALNKLPFFCTAQAIDKIFIQSGVPAFKFSEKMKLCKNYSAKGYDFYKQAYPDWLYSSSLFTDDSSQPTQPLRSLLDF